MATSAIFLEKFQARVLGNFFFTQPVFYGFVVSNLGKSCDEVRDLIEFIRLELGSFLPAFHAPTLRCGAEIFHVVRVSQKATHPASRAETGEVGGHLFGHGQLAVLPAFHHAFTIHVVTGQALLFENLHACVQWIVQQNVS